VVTVRRIGHRLHPQCLATHERRVLEGRVQTPQAHTLSNVTGLIESARVCAHSCRAAVVWNLLAQQLPGAVVPDLERQTGGRVTVVVRGDKVIVCSRWHDSPGDLVCALFCRRASLTPRHIVLARLVSDGPRDIEHVDVGGGLSGCLGRRTFLEIEPVVHVVSDGLVRPWDGLLGIEEVPTVVAGPFRSIVIKQPLSQNLHIQCVHNLLKL